MIIVDGVIVLSAISSQFGPFFVLNIEYKDTSTAT